MLSKQCMMAREKQLVVVFILENHSVTSYLIYIHFVGMGDKYMIKFIVIFKIAILGLYYNFGVKIQVQNVFTKSKMSYLCPV